MRRQRVWTTVTLLGLGAAAALALLPAVWAQSAAERHRDGGSAFRADRPSDRRTETFGRYPGTGEGLRFYDPYAEELLGGARSRSGIEYDPYYYDPDRYQGVRQPRLGPLAGARSVGGEVLGFEELRGGLGEPEGVRMRVRTPEGRVRTLFLGDRPYVARNLPPLRRGDRIQVRGRFVDADGRRLFRAAEIRARGGDFLIPNYEWSRTVRGRIAQVREVAVQDGRLDAAVARVETPGGRSLDILVGPASALGGRGETLRPGMEVEAIGFVRRVGDRREFYVQDVRPLGG